jgi:hypothetical protein
LIISQNLEINAMYPSQRGFLNGLTIKNLVTAVRMAAAASPSLRIETDRVIANGRALKTHRERAEAVKTIRSPVLKGHHTIKVHWTHGTIASNLLAD